MMVPPATSLVAVARVAPVMVLLVLALTLGLTTAPIVVGRRRARRRVDRTITDWRRARRHRPGPESRPPTRGPLGSAARHAGRGLQWLRWLRPRSDVEHAALLESVARSMRSGCSLTQALEEACAAPQPRETATDLSGVLRSVRAGVPLAEALSAWAACDDAARRLAGAALTLGAELGGASARSLDAAACGLRDRAALAREVRALTSQARTSAVVMVAAPVAFVVLGAATDRRVAQGLLTTPTGLACILAGVALDLIGAAWMARMTRRIT